MSSKLEQLKNIIIMVIENNFITFGTEEHLQIIELLENIKRISDIKNLNNEIVNKAIKYISENKKLLNVLENDINVDLKSIIKDAN